MHYIPHDWHREGSGRGVRPDPYATAPAYGLAFEMIAFLGRIFLVTARQAKAASPKQPVLAPLDDDACHNQAAVPSSPPLKDQRRREAR